MSDDATIRDALRRTLHLTPSPGLTERGVDHARRVARGEVEPPPFRVPVRTVAATLALTAAFAVGGVVVMQHRTGARLSPPPSSANTQPGVNAASPSSDLSQPTAAPVGTPTAAARTGAASATSTPSPSAVAIPDCQDADLSGRLDTGGGTTYTVGSTVTVRETVGNRAAHPCQLPYWCYYNWRAFDSAGRQVAAGPATADCVTGVPHDVLQPGGSEQSSPTPWDTSGMAPGTYTIKADLNGMARTTTTITLVAAATPPPTAAPPTPTPTPTPLVP